jgi:hypothetical protein
MVEMEGVEPSYLKLFPELLRAYLIFNLTGTYKPTNGFPIVMSSLFPPNDKLGRSILQMRLNR